MSVTLKSRLRRALFGAATVVVALSMTAGPAAADTLLSSSGLVGSSSLNEGVNCWYNKNALINAISLQAPTIYARNVTGGVDYQEVGWMWTVKRQKVGSSTSTNFFKSPVSRATAADSTKATFLNQAIGITVPNDGSKYFVVAKLFWYASDGSVVGTVQRLFTVYYEHVYSGGTFQQTSCYRHTI